MARDAVHVGVLVVRKDDSTFCRSEHRVGNRFDNRTARLRSDQSADCSADDVAIDTPTGDVPP